MTIELNSKDVESQIINIVEAKDWARGLKEKELYEKYKWPAGKRYGLFWKRKLVGEETFEHFKFRANHDTKFFSFFKSKIDGWDDMIETQKKDVSFLVEAIKLSRAAPTITLSPDDYHIIFVRYVPLLKEWREATEKILLTSM